MRLVDRALKTVGLQRIPKTKAQSWSGARHDRLTLDWIWTHLSADEDIRGSLETLRARARELVRNDAWAKRYVRLMVKNIIGPRGVQLQARLMRGDLPNGEVNQKIEASWKRWGKRGTPTADGKLSWLGVQRLAVKSLAMDGEVLIRILRGFDNPFGFALQFIDPDQLDVTFNRVAEPGVNAIKMSVEVDPWNRPVAYHLFKRHPSDPGASRERIPVPAADIIHLYDPDRVNQTRGVPWLAPVMLDVHMLNGYYEAELVAAREAAAKGGHYVQKMEDGAVVEVKVEDLTSDVEPGKRDILPYGMEFQPWDPQHPNTAFPEFSKALLHKMASGGDVAYASLTNDLADTSYSSSRVGLLDERDSYRDFQGLVIESLHAPVFAEWAPMAVLNGQLDARIRTVDYQTAVEWVPRGWEWVDPEKDVNASIIAIDNGLTSRSRVLAEQGKEFEDVLDDLAAEEALIAEKGLTLGTDKTAAAQQNQADRTQRDLINNQPAGRRRLLGVTR